MQNPKEMMSTNPAPKGMRLNWLQVCKADTQMLERRSERSGSSGDDKGALAIGIVTSGGRWQVFFTYMLSLSGRLATAQLSQAGVRECTGLAGDP
jgi:hypothetical protein